MRFLLLGCILTMILTGCNVDDGPSGEPYQLPTPYWRGWFMRNNSLDFISVQIEQDGPKLTGSYRFGGSHRSFEGSLEGKIGSETAVITLKAPEGNAYSDITLNMALNQECTPEEAQEARGFLNQQKGVPPSMLTRKLYKMNGNATYKFGDTDEMLIGYLTESVKEDPKSGKK